MLPTCFISIKLRITKINKKNFLWVAIKAYRGVLGLDVAVNNIAIVNVGQPKQELHANQQRSLHRELTIAKGHQISNWWTQLLHDHVIVVFCLAIFVELRDTFNRVTIEVVQNIRLFLKRGRLGSPTLKFNDTVPKTLCIVCLVDSSVAAKTNFITHLEPFG